MRPKRAGKSTKANRKIVIRTIEVKKENIRKPENGVRVSGLALEYGLAQSSICTILKNKEAIKDANVLKT